jgi:toxin ParE1/3/4
MVSYKLNDEAQEDIKRIYKRGLAEHGETQADAYYDAFFRRFERIAEQPYLYPSVEHIRSGYRRSVCGVDSIYYRIVEDAVEIMRIIGRQDIDQS